MVLHVFISFLGGVSLCILYGLYSGTSLGGTTRGILGGFPGRVRSYNPIPVCLLYNLSSQHCPCIRAQQRSKNFCLDQRNSRAQ